MNSSSTNTNIRWRTSASLILIAPATAAVPDYHLLMLKRSDATAVAHNQTVFPGGVLDTDADESVAWIEYFEQFGVSQEALRSLVLINGPRPAMLAPQGTGCYDRFFKRSKIWAREITLRLTALRECFEEVGILLCRSRKQLDQLGDDILSAQFVENFDRTVWQHRVHNKPSDFLELCRELNVVPDLWALYEWSAWASPAVFKKGYETVFYTVFIKEQPSLLAEPTEVKECLWRTPSELLHLYHLGELWFMPPQIYELSRLLVIKDYRQLLAFAAQRSKLGSTLFMPVMYHCSDGMVFALPGDDLYVPDPHLSITPIEVSETVVALGEHSKRQHRYEYSDQNAFKLYLNFSPPDGHLTPQKIQPEQNKL